jgi:hypothetical protein
MFAFFEGDRMHHILVDPLARRIVRQRIVSPNAVNVEMQIRPRTFALGNYVSVHPRHGLLLHGGFSLKLQFAFNRATYFCDTPLVRCHTLKVRDNEDVQVTPRGSTSKNALFAACDGEGV